MRRCLEGKLWQMGCYPQLFVTSIPLLYRERNHRWALLPNRRSLYPGEVLYSAERKIPDLDDVVRETLDRHRESIRRSIRRSIDFILQLFVTVVFAVEDTGPGQRENLRAYEIDILRSKIDLLEKKRRRPGRVTGATAGTLRLLVDFEEDGAAPLESFASLPSEDDLLEAYYDRLETLLQEDPGQGIPDFSGRNETLVKRVAEQLPAGGKVNLLGLCVWERVVRLRGSFSTAVVRRVFVNREFADEVGVALLQSLLLSSNITKRQRSAARGYLHAVEKAWERSSFRFLAFPELERLGNLFFCLFDSIRQDFDMSDDETFNRYMERLAGIMNDIMFFFSSQAVVLTPASPSSGLSLEVSSAPVIEVSSVYENFRRDLGRTGVSFKTIMKDVLYNFFRALHSVHFLYLEPLKEVSPTVGAFLRTLADYESAYGDEPAAIKREILNVFSEGERERRFFHEEAPAEKMVPGNILGELFLREQLLCDIPGVCFAGEKQELLPSLFRFGQNECGCFFPSELSSCGYLQFLQPLTPTPLLVHPVCSQKTLTTRETQNLIKLLVKRIKQVDSFEDPVNVPGNHQEPGDYACVRTVPG